MLIFPFGIKILGDQLKMTRQRALNPVRTITFMMTIFWVYPLSSCRKHVAYDDNPLMTIPAASQRKTTGTNPQSQAALPVQKIDGSLLLTTIKSVEEYKLGGHTGVTINIDRGNEPDFYQFYICETKTSKCSPKPQTPGEFVFASHQFHYPPTGLVEVSVRACIRAEKAIDPNQLCGKFAVESISLSGTENPKVADLLKEREGILSDGKKDCSDFFENTKYYYDILRTDPNLTQMKFTESVKQQLDMGKDLSCELIYSTVYDDMSKVSENSTEQNTQEKSTEKKGWTPKAITLVSLGGASVLVGGAFIAKSAGFDITSALSKALRLSGGSASGELVQYQNYYQSLSHELSHGPDSSFNLSANSNTQDAMDKIRLLYENQARNIEIQKSKLAENLEKIREASLR